MHQSVACLWIVTLAITYSQVTKYNDYFIWFDHSITINPSAADKTEFCNTWLKPFTYAGGSKFKSHDNKIEFDMDAVEFGVFDVALSAGDISLFMQTAKTQITIKPTSAAATVTLPNHIIFIRPIDTRKQIMFVSCGKQATDWRHMEILHAIMKTAKSRINLSKPLDIYNHEHVFNLVNYHDINIDHPHIHALAIPELVSYRLNILFFDRKLIMGTKNKAGDQIKLIDLETSLGPIWSIYSRNLLLSYPEQISQKRWGNLAAINGGGIKPTLSAVDILQNNVNPKIQWKNNVDPTGIKEFETKTLLKKRGDSNGMYITAQYISQDKRDNILFVYGSTNHGYDQSHTVKQEMETFAPHYVFMELDPDRLVQGSSTTAHIKKDLFYTYIAAQTMPQCQAITAADFAQHIYYPPIFYSIDDYVFANEKDLYKMIIFSARNHLMLSAINEYIIVNKIHNSKIWITIGAAHLRNPKQRDIMRPGVMRYEYSYYPVDMDLLLTRSYKRTQNPIEMEGGKIRFRVDLFPYGEYEIDDEDVIDVNFLDDFKSYKFDKIEYLLIMFGIFIWIAIGLIVCSCCVGLLVGYFGIGSKQCNDLQIPV